MCGLCVEERGKWHLQNCVIKGKNTSAVTINPEE